MLVELSKRQPKGWGAKLAAPRPATGHEGFTVLEYADSRISLQLDNPHAPFIYDCVVAHHNGTTLQLEVQEVHK